jgi:hypothetical protein
MGAGRKTMGRGAVWSPRCALATISLLTARFFCVGGDGASFFCREIRCSSVNRLVYFHVFNSLCILIHKFVHREVLTREMCLSVSGPRECRSFDKAAAARVTDMWSPLPWPLFFIQRSN